MTEKVKITQGQIKTRQRLKELLENEEFKEDLKYALSIPNQKKKNKF